MNPHHQLVKEEKFVKEIEQIKLEQHNLKEILQGVRVANSSSIIFEIIQ